MSHILAYRTTWMENFLNWGSLLPYDSSLCQHDKNLTTTGTFKGRNFQGKKRLCCAFLLWWKLELYIRVFQPYPGGFHLQGRVFIMLLSEDKPGSSFWLPDLQLLIIPVIVFSVISAPSHSEILFCEEEPVTFWTFLLFKAVAFWVIMCSVHNWSYAGLQCTGAWGSMTTDVWVIIKELLTYRHLWLLLEGCLFKVCYLISTRA